MGVVQLLHACLDFTQTGAGVAEAGLIRAGIQEDGTPGDGGELCGALLLDPVDILIDAANLQAETLLFRDTGFESMDVEADDIGTSGDEGVGKGAEESDALLQEL